MDNEFSSFLGKVSYFIYIITAATFTFTGASMLFFTSLFDPDVVSLVKNCILNFLIMAAPFTIYGIENFFSNISAEMNRKYNKVACFHFAAISVFTLFSFISCAVRIVFVL